MDRVFLTVILLNCAIATAASGHKYKFSSRGKKIAITHETGPGRWHGGRPDDILFTVIGRKGETSEHLCRADREQGEIGTCAFTDDTEIGRPKALRIRNAGNDFWAFVSVEVEVDGQTIGTWDGFKGVGKKKAVFLKLTYHEEELEDLVQDGPMLGCQAGGYMTELGCRPCGVDTFSDDGASSCTSCPEGMVSESGSTSINDCRFAPCEPGYFMTQLGCAQCPHDTYSGPGAVSCTKCPEEKSSPAGSGSIENCSYKKYPACDCFTPECNYCRDSSCSITFLNSTISLSSILRWKDHNILILFGEGDEELGRFYLSMGRLSLTGCLQCPTPRALRKSVTKRQATDWVFSMKAGLVTVEMGGEVVYRSQLRGECAAQYQHVHRVAFFRVQDTCTSTFLYNPLHMELGDKLRDGSCQVSQPCEDE